MVSLPTILLILAAVSMGTTVIAALVAIRSGREARSAIFPIVREEETVRTRQAWISVFILSAVTALFLGGWLATVRLAPASNPQTIAVVESVQPGDITFVTETPTSVADSGPQPPLPTPVLPASPVAPTNTPVPPETVTPPSLIEATATPLLPTATPTLSATPRLPTATSTSTPVIINRFLTAVPRTPAPAGVKMGPIQFAQDITSNIEAINPKNFFPQGTRSVYAVYPYNGMVDGINFAAVWYQNGQELWRDEQVWRWGKAAQFYSFLNPPGEGLYRLDLYVNDSIVATGLFEIR